jgi:secreted trypsin-like serine protease
MASASAIIPKIPTLATVYVCNPKTISCGCGREIVKLMSSTIIGGQPAAPASWTMIVSLRINGSNQHVCGGSILNDYFILTAAHCVDKSPRHSPTGVYVRVGFTSLSEGAQVILEVDQIFLHPKYIGSSDGYQNDIAILHLSESLDIDNDPFIKRTCVPHLDVNMNVQQYPANGIRLAVIGWGMVGLGTNNMSNAMQQAEVFVIDNDDSTCKVLIKDKDTHFCAGVYNVIQGLYLCDVL